jgi:hypothetical protein
MYTLCRQVALTSGINTIDSASKRDLNNMVSNNYPNCAEDGLLRPECPRNHAYRCTDNE